MLANWIRQTTTTTGTGNLTLSSVTGYPTFANQFSEGQRFQYQILDDATGAPIESGVGYLSSGALVRERIECTMVSGTFDNSTPSAVSLAAGTKRVICGPSAATIGSTVAGAWAPSGGVKGYGDGVTVFGTGSTSFTLTASRAIALPFTAQSAQEIDAVVTRVTTQATSGGLIRGAIYSVGANGLPDVQLAVSGTVAADTTGIKEMTFTAFRPPQRFFAAIISTNGPQVYAAQDGCASSPLGFTSSMEPVGYVFLAGSGTTFPASWTGASHEVVYGFKPVVGVRCV